MFRSVLRRSSPLPLVGGVAGAHGRSYAKVRTTEVVTGFDAAWRAMGKEERDKIIKEYAAYEAQDWHSLSLEQKRASIPRMMVCVTRRLPASSLHDCVWGAGRGGSVRGVQGAWRSCRCHGGRPGGLCVCTQQRLHPWLRLMRIILSSCSQPAPENHVARVATGPGRVPSQPAWQPHLWHFLYKGTECGIRGHCLVMSRSLSAHSILKLRLHDGGNLIGAAVAL